MKTQFHPLILRLLRLFIARFAVRNGKITDQKTLLEIKGSMRFIN